MPRMLERFGVTPGAKVRVIQKSEAAMPARCSRSALDDRPARRLRARRRGASDDRARSARCSARSLIGGAADERLHARHSRPATARTWFGAGVAACVLRRPRVHRRDRRAADPAVRRLSHAAGSASSSAGCRSASARTASARWACCSRSPTGSSCCSRRSSSPTNANKACSSLAPVLMIMPALAAWAVIPFAPEAGARRHQRRPALHHGAHLDRASTA